MPMHRIFSTPGTFSEKDKQELAARITGFYETLGLPKFYVIVLFVPLEEQDFYVGGKQNAGGKFVRILVDHVSLFPLNFKYFPLTFCLLQIARQLPFNLQVGRFFAAYENALAPYIKDRGLDWEVTQINFQKTQIN
jgi:phenylpyruvate tautomerase PptA (4-oxalocrotonate tautomerase family)